MTERFNRYELQKDGKSKPRNISAVVADPGIPELHGVPPSITNLMLKESRDISKDHTLIVKGMVTVSTFYIKKIKISLLK